MAHKDILEELKDGIQTGRIPLVTNPYVDEERKVAYREPFIKALEAGIAALDKHRKAIKCLAFGAKSLGLLSLGMLAEYFFSR